MVKRDFFFVCHLRNHLMNRAHFSPIFSDKIPVAIVKANSRDDEVKFALEWLCMWLKYKEFYGDKGTVYDIAIHNI